MTTEPTGYEASQSTLGLVLGILAVVCLPLLGPAAWAVARAELKAIDAGRRDPSNRGTARAAQVLGIIGSLILVAAVVVGLVVLIVEGPELLRGITDFPQDNDGLEAGPVVLSVLLAG